MQEGPGEAAVAALREATETPERLWTAAMMATTAEEVAHLAAQAHAAQVSLPVPDLFTSLHSLLELSPRVLEISECQLSNLTILT